MATRNGTICQTCGSTTNSFESTDGLRGAVAPNDHKSYTRLGKILGLSNKQAVKEWMDSKAFKPAFQRLYDNWIVVQQDAARQAVKYRKRGPDLRAVVEAIDDPFAVTELRYTSLMGVDLSEFYEIDHYALCLVELRASNKVRVNGLFRGKTCT